MKYFNISCHKHVIFEPNIAIVHLIFHVINFYFFLKHVIFERNIRIFNVIFSCHLNKFMTYFFHKYFVMSDLLIH